MTPALPVPDLADQLALLLRATALMGAAWAAAAALRAAGASAAARHMAWLLGIAALLALPVLWWLIPALQLPVLPAEVAANSVPQAGSAPAPFDSGRPTPSAAPDPAGWAILLPLVYALGAATLLVRLLIGRRMLARLWSDSGPAADPALERLLSRLAFDMRLVRPVELRIAWGPAVPMTWGTLAPKILLPAEACEWPAERRRLVLLHELAHVARRDSFSRSLASLVCALYWFHPGAWLAARRMRMEQEHAADDRVLASGGSPQAYALSLLHLARGSAGRRDFAQAAEMAGMYQLEVRLVSITGASPRNRPGALFLSSSALLAGLTTLLVAAGVPVSATQALPADLQPDRADQVKPVDSARGEERSTAQRPAQMLSSEPAPFGQRSAGPEPEPAPSAAREPVRPDRTLASARVPAAPGGQGNPDGRQRAVDPQPLRNYGWELPRSGFQARTDALAESARVARLELPDAESSSSGDRTGSPKWARNAPRLARGQPPAGPIPSTKGPLVLSWSLPVGGQ